MKPTSDAKVFYVFEQNGVKRIGTILPKSTRKNARASDSRNN